MQTTELIAQQKIQLIRQMQQIRESFILVIEIDRPQAMGTKFYEFADSNLPYIQSLSSLKIQQQPLEFVTHPPKQVVLISQQNPLTSLKKSGFTATESTPTTIDKKPSQSSLRQSSLRQSNTSKVKSINQQNQALALKMMLGVMRKKKIVGGFKEAKEEIIEKYNNTEIKDIPHPLVLDNSIVSIPYEQKPKPYYIKLEQLPVEGYKMPSSWVYLGQWFEGFPHGIGKMYHYRFKYEGYFHRGIPHLKGRRVTTEQIYQGDFVMNKREGFGRLVTRSQYYYEGGWVDDVREGEGYEIHRNGCVFQGQYVDDKVSFGSFYIPSDETRKKLHALENYAYLNLIRTQFKQKYYGQFLNNKFDGKGDYVWSDGRMYQGSWKNGKMHGQGSFSWSNGKRYEGEYMNNKKHGYGKFFSFTKTYQGFWEFGKPHGKGKVIQGDRVFYRIWNCGRVIREDDEQEMISMMSSEEEKFPDELSSPKLSQYQLQSVNSKESQYY